MKKTLLNTGFTLIELLVVVAIIGILTAVLSANFLTAKSKSRDAKRVSDLSQIQLALEQAFDKCNQYPASGALTTSTSVCSGVTLGNFMSVVPTDSGTAYAYVSSPSSNATDYVLRAKLENLNPSVLTDDVDGAPLGQAAGYCDDSAPNNIYYCVQPK